MSIFGPRRPVHEVTAWRPVPGDPDGYHVTDAGPAYRVRFRLPPGVHPEAEIHIYVWAAEDAPGTFTVAHRAECRVNLGSITRVGGVPWSRSLTYWMTSPPYRSMADADEAARHSARELSAPPRTGLPWDGFQCFDWDGAPW